MRQVSGHWLFPGAGGGGGAGGLDQQGGQRGSRPKSQHVENLLRVIKAAF